jgi:hypothetical protein
LERPLNQVVPRVASVVDDWLRLTVVEKVVDALKRLLPLKVLLFARSVEDAAVTVSVPPTLKVEPLIVPSDPVMRLVPIDVVETTLPVASVPKSALVRPVKYVEPATVSAVELAYVAFQLVDQPVVMVPRVEEELAKVLRPVKVLLLVRSVEEAAVMVIDPPAFKVVPLIVPREPVR